MGRWLWYSTLPASLTALGCKPRPARGSGLGIPAIGAGSSTRPHVRGEMAGARSVGYHPLDLLERVSITGALKATASLSALAGRPVASSFPVVRIVPLEQVPNLLGDPEQVIAGVILEVSGDVSGFFIVVFPLADAFLLVNTLTGSNYSLGTGPGETVADLDAAFGEMEISAICEAGNILASSYLAALEDLAGLSVVPSPPVAAIDMAGAVLTTAVLPLHEAGSEILFIEARFGDDDHELGGRMALVPTTESLPRLLAAVSQSG
jgi:chemotaxis protein CheC